MKTLQFQIRPARHPAVLIGACLAAVFLISGCSRDANSATAPTAISTSYGLHCSEPVWDLGEVMVKGDTVNFDHTFRLENRSDKPIRLQKINSNCGCLVANDYAHLIEPSGHSDVKVTMSVFGPPGGFERMLTITDQSEPSEKLTLRINGRRAVSGMLFTAPTTLHFGTLGRNELKTRKLVVSRHDGSAVNFRSVISGNSAVSFGGEAEEFARTDTVRERHNCVELTILLDSQSLPAGSFKCEIKIRTSSPDESTAELPVIVEALVLEPESPWVESLFVDRLAPGEVIELPLSKAVSSTEFPHILSMSFQGDGSIHLELVPGVLNERGAIAPRVKVSRTNALGTKGVARGNLTVETAAAGGKRVVVIRLVAFLTN